jgi:hypothetical protein
MDLNQASQRRSLAGWAGALFFLLAFLALLDGLIGQFREPANLIKLLPGQTTEIDGPLQEEVTGVRELTYFSDSDLLTISFATVHKGYFLGGLLWRGQITASPRLQPGEYHLTVTPLRSTSPEATLGFRIEIFSDPRSLRRSSKSLIRYYTGISPWGAAAACLPGILLAFGALFFLSQKRDQLLALKGRAEIYRVIKKDGVFEIHFGLGTEHGVQPGLQLQVYDPRGKPAGLARVETATQTDAVATVATDQQLRAGFMVATLGS